MQQTIYPIVTTVCPRSDPAAHAPRTPRAMCRVSYRHFVKRLLVVVSHRSMRTVSRHSDGQAFDRRAVYARGLPGTATKGPYPRGMATDRARREGRGRARWWAAGGE